MKGEESTELTKTVHSCVSRGCYCSFYGFLGRMNILTPVIWIRSKIDFKIGRSIFPRQKKNLAVQLCAKLTLNTLRLFTVVHKVLRLKFMTKDFFLIRATSKVALRSVQLNLDSNP